MSKPTQNLIERPPVVVIMGHIDHGKSTLLDYIRKSNIVAKEAGGITQHLGAYEIEHKNSEGVTKKITFLDTPGHEAFCGVRSRGSKVADIAILLISAEDSVMPQTLEALEWIKKEKHQFIVAINKIDSPKANPDKVKTDLIEHGVYVEGYGGDIPAVGISAKIGTGVNDLLDLILIAAEVEGLKADTSKPAEGFVIETHKDKNKGTSATLVIKDGTLNQGQFVVCENSYCPIRIFEDHNGKIIKNATFSKPVKTYGWSNFPVVGSTFVTCNSKKEAEKICESNLNKTQPSEKNIAGKNSNDSEFVIPIIIKGDNFGSIEAIEYELKKIIPPNAKLKVVSTSTGNITEIDVKVASSNPNSIIVGFGIEIDKQATIMIDRLAVPVKTFDIIYELVDWIKSEVETKRPRMEIEESIGVAKILKRFNETKHNQVLGGRVNTGKIKVGGEIKILRRGEEVGRGKIKELQSNKSKVSEVAEGTECGMCIDAKLEIVPGDEIEVFEKVSK